MSFPYNYMILHLFTKPLQLFIVSSKPKLNCSFFSLFFFFFWPVAQSLVLIKCSVCPCSRFILIYEVSLNIIECDNDAVLKRSDPIMSSFVSPGLKCIAPEKIRYMTPFLPNLPSAQPKIQTLCLQKKTSSQELYLCSHTGEPWTIQQTLEMLHFSPQSLLWNNNEKKAMSNS